MAIAFDNVSSVQGTSVSSVTIPAFLVGGSDRLIFVGVSSSSATPALTTSVVRNSTPNETFTEKWDVTAQTTLHNSGHYFINPVAGSFSITVTVAAVQDFLAAGAISLTGVDQTTGVGTHGTANGNSGTASVTVAAAADEWLADVVITDITAITVGADQTSRWEQDAGFPASGGSTQLGSANDVMSWTFAADIWAIGAVPVLPAAAAFDAALTAAIQYPTQGPTITRYRMVPYGETGHHDA